METFKDEIGNRYGKLLVIERAPTPEDKKGAYWLCKCDCGNEAVVLGTNLRREGTKSCGCFRKKALSNRKRIKKGQSAFNNIYINYRAPAMNRGLVFDLSKDEFKEITGQNCHYCGVEPKQISKTRYRNGDYVYNGIDRIDSSKGYMLDNIVPCCAICNHAKMDMNYDEFIEHLDRLVKFRRKR